MDELWDISRVAQYLGVSERTVYNKVRSGDLPAVKMGRLWRVRESELSSWLVARGTASAGAVPVFVRGPYPYGSVDESLSAAEARPIPSRSKLERLLTGTEETLRRRILFVGLLSAAVQDLGWPAPVVVGGHAVEFYSDGDYPTLDIDLAGSSEPIAHVLSEWGFEREGRHWFDDALNIVVEVPGGHLSPAQLEHVASVRSQGVTAYVIGIEDLIVDRLAACVFWKHEDSCDWARTLIKGSTEMDLDYLRQRAAEEEVLERLESMLEGP
jgi:excisionase family DNA binding protein